MFRFINFIFILALLSLSACSEKTSEERLEIAKEYIKQNARPAAIIELKNILLKDPGNKIARTELAAVYISLGSAESAAKEARLALDDNIESDRVLPILARSLQLLGEHQEIIDLVDMQADVKLNTEVTAEIYFYKTLAAFALNNEDSALKTSTKIQTLYPQTKFGKLTDAYTKAHNKELVAANELVESLLIEHPDFVDALYLKGLIEFEQKSFKNAISTFQKYENLVPEDKRAKLLISQVFMKDGDSDSALAYLKNLYNSISGSPIVNQLLAMNFYNQKTFDLAQRHAEYAIQNGLDNPTNRLIAGVSAYQLKNSEQAYKNLNNIRNRLPEGHPALQVLAAAQLELGYQIEAEDTLKRLEEYGLVSAELFTTASLLYISTGDSEKAKEMLDISKNAENKDSPEILARQAILKLTMQDLSGIDELERIVENSTNAALANVTLARVYVSTKQYEKALDLAGQWQSSDKDGVRTAGWVLAGEVARITKDYPQADKAFNEVLKLSPNNPASLMYFAKQSLDNGQAKEALDLTTTVLQKSPDYISALAMQYTANKALNRTSKGLELIAQSYKNNSSDVQYLLFYVSTLRDMGNFHLAAETLSKHKLKPSENLPDIYWTTLIDSYEQTINYEKMLTSINEWISDDPKNKSAHLKKIEFFARQNSQANALKATENALRVFPNELKFKILEINFLSLVGKHREAQSKLAKVDTKLISTSQVGILQGRIDYAYGNYEKALRNLLAGYSDYPTSVNVASIFKSYLALKQTTKALDFIQQHLIDNPSDISSLSMLGDYQINTSLEEALVSYKRMLDVEENNVNALNNVAWVSLQLGDKQTALKYSERAANLAPEYPPILDTYGEALLENGRAKEAYEVLTKASKLDPSSKEISLHLEKAKQATGM